MPLFKRNVGDTWFRAVCPKAEQERLGVMFTPSVAKNLLAYKKEFSTEFAEYKFRVSEG